MFRRCLASAVAMILGSAALAHADDTTGPGVPAFVVRPGYRVTLIADHLEEARFLEFGEKGTLFVSEPDHGRIRCLRDPDADGVYKTQTVFVSNKHLVQSMQWVKGELWFAQSGSIHKARSTKNNGIADVVDDIECGDLPEGGGHWYRSLLVDDDGFYTSIGDDGNINDHRGDDREKIWHFSLDGSNKKLFCSGIRNTEKLRYRPGTKEVWGCDHGSDNFGAYIGEHKNGIDQPVTDLNPPDEFNHYVQDGFYGHPFVVGNRLPRPEWIGKPGVDMADLCTKTIPPAWCNGAHWANNGWCFTTTPKLTGQIGDAIIAFHGSWNSSRRVGYCIQRVEFDPMTNNPCGTTTLVSLLAADHRQVLGRPVDCLEETDGSILFSDDAGHRIFRLTKVGG